MSATVYVSVTVEGEVAGYPQTLLNLAKRMIDTGEGPLCSMGVVLCHTACEIGTERALSSALQNREIADLQEAIWPPYRGYSLTNANLLKLYTDLTGDDITKSPFWSGFKALAARRNGIVHGGKFVTRDEAHESHEAATQLLAHLMQM